MQFDSNQPFKVPKPPPKKLVKIKSFIVPIISFLPEIPIEKFPPKTKPMPSSKKLKIGIITIIATIKDTKNRGLNSENNFFDCLIKIFKNKIYYALSYELNLQQSS